MSLNPADKPGAADAILVAKKAIALYGQGANEQMSEIARDVSTDMRNVKTKISDRYPGHESRFTASLRYCRSCRRRPCRRGAVNFHHSAAGGSRLWLCWCRQRYQSPKLPYPYTVK